MASPPHRLLSRFLRVRREQWLPRDELRARQWSRLERMLRHAYECSPHYRRVFETLGTHPDEIGSPEALARLPLLRKAHIREPETLLARGYRLEELPSSFTSGSTGEGARTYFDPDGWEIGKYLIKTRARLACGVRPWDRIAQFQWIPNRDTWLRRNVLRQRSFGIEGTVDEGLDEAVRYAPTVIYGFPGHLQRLGRAAGGRLRPRMVITSGEILTEEMRASIESSLGGVVYDVYGCTEMKEIAWECPARDGYHINADWLYVEILDEPFDGAPAGSIVVTSLYNRAMPLIRYLVGDAGHFREGSCPCGRSLPLMAPEVGRQVDYVRLPDGTEVSPYTAMTPVEAYPPVAQFEMLQREVERIVVRVVPADRWSEAESRALTELVAPVLPGLEIVIEVVDDIAPQRGGKYRIVQSHLDRA